MEIKRILEGVCLENESLFSFVVNLHCELGVCNGDIHFTTKFKPNELVRAKDINIINLALKITKNSHKIFNKYNNGFTKGDLYLIYENNNLKDKNINFKKFVKKGKYSIPFIIKGIKGTNEYIINFPLDYRN